MIIQDQNCFSLLEWVMHLTMLTLLFLSFQAHVICLFVGVVLAVSSHFREKERNCAVIFHFVITDNRS